MPDNVTGTLAFLSDLEKYDIEKPFYANDPVVFEPEHGATTNVKSDYVEHDIEDIRGREHEFDDGLDRWPFQVVSHPSRCMDWDNLDNFAAYKRETEKFLANKFNAVKVVCFDVMLRSNEPRQEAPNYGAKDPRRPNVPALITHNDLSHDGSINMMSDHLTEDELGEYCNGKYRVRMMNMWRPLVDKIKSRPLAMCDPHTVDSRDVYRCDRIAGDWLSEIYVYKYNPKQKWYWLSEQTRDELWLFMLWDSEKDMAKSRSCPHTSFEDHRYEGPNASPRRSVETRNIVIEKIRD